MRDSTKSTEVLGTIHTRRRDVFAYENETREIMLLVVVGGKW
jgi:hypothetical protein